jgi:2-amino-4-hydroxy-6-hydroxymethyldihydropteridine diphosphokinase
MNKAYLLLGSNLEDRSEMIQKALVLIAERIGTILQSSSVYESDPWGFRSENRFLNQVVVVETELLPGEILAGILQIETGLGRTRQSRNAGYSSRVIDIDILFYNDEIIREAQLDIPHPRIQERMFALVPLCELNASFVHPVYQKTLHDLKSECIDRNAVERYLN